MGDSETKNGKPARGPHPATIQRKTATPPVARGKEKGPHPATIQKKSATPKSARKEKGPHPATVQRKAATPPSTRAERGPHPATIARQSSAPGKASVSTAKDGSVTLAQGSTVFYGTSHSALQAFMREGTLQKGKGETSLSVTTAMDTSPTSRIGTSGAVLELQIQKSLQGQTPTRAQPKMAEPAEPAAAPKPADFEVEKRTGRTLQCRMTESAVASLNPVAVHVRNATGAWTRFTLTQYREMVGR